MPKATMPSGILQELKKGYLFIPNYGTIYFNNIPEISDSKNSVYNGEGIIGRSSPIHTYSHSDTRIISIQFHYFVLQESDIETNLSDLRAIQSCGYPREGQKGAPFLPPPICKLRFGDVLAKEEDLCVIQQNCSLKIPTDAAFDEETYCPYKFDIDTTWWVVYTSDELPTQSRILTSGR